MLKYRLISGSLMILAVFFLFWADGKLETVAIDGWLSRLFNDRPALPPGLVLTGLMCLLVPLAARELCVIFTANGIYNQPWLISIAGIASAMTMFMTSKSLTAPTGVVIIASVLVACFVFTLIWHSRHASVEGVVAAAGATMFAVAYLGIMGGFYLAIRRWHSAWVVLAVIIITKMGDTGAYTIGRMIGRHKLIPWLSPGKTWEGLGGAVLFSTLFAIAFAWAAQTWPDISVVHRTVDGRLVVLHQSYSILGAAIAGVLFALVGHAGDLTVSLFKRDAGLKDSGNIIPGFGGVLDVLDSPLLVAPVAYWMLEWTSNR
jgi:phosphatidate cytidylyltransferase